MGLFAVPIIALRNEKGSYNTSTRQHKNQKDYSTAK